MQNAWVLYLLRSLLIHEYGAGTHTLTALRLHDGCCKRQDLGSIYTAGSCGVQALLNQ